jgi:hypothetical protein
MARCTDALGALVLAAVLPGCVTGHLFTMGRRWEQAVAFHEAAVRDGRLGLAYDAEITDGAGDVLARRPRRAEVMLGDVRPGVPVDAVRVVWLADDAALAGTPLSIVQVPRDGSGPVELQLGRGGADAVSLWSNVLTRRRVAPWVYPLVPLAVAVDAGSLPWLFFFAPGAMVIGD